MTTLIDLQRDVVKADLSTLGDRYEREAWVHLKPEFPAYEAFWRLFVFPYRLRGSIIINPDLSRAHEAVCMYNYSTLRSLYRLHELLASAKERKATTGDTTSELFEDFYTRLAMLHDHVKKLVSASYWALKVRSDPPSGRLFVKNWEASRDILDPAKDWLNSTTPPRFDEIETAIDIENTYRNHIIHGPKWAGFQDRVPRRDQINELMYWSQWHKMRERSEEELLKKTEEREVVLQRSWQDACVLLESVWDSVIDLVLREHGRATPVNSQFISLDVTDMEKTLSVPADSVSSSANSAHIVVLDSSSTQ
jgi:hypothetical protein